MTERGTAAQSFEAFREAQGDDLLSAVAAAFAMVACADGKLAENEVDRFGVVVGKSPALGGKPAIDALEARFRKVCEAILSNFDAGYARAREAEAAVRGNAEHAKLVIGAAQIAIIADEELAEVEEVALRNVREALGVNPAGY